MGRAACAGQTRIFFTDGRADHLGQAVARRICAACGVRCQSTSLALELLSADPPLNAGVWAGVTVSGHQAERRLRAIADEPGPQIL